jgi:hypothetical protein
MPNTLLNHVPSKHEGATMRRKRLYCGGPGRRTDDRNVCCGGVELNTANGAAEQSAALGLWQRAVLAPWFGAPPKPWCCQCHKLFDQCAQWPINHDRLSTARLDGTVDGLQHGYAQSITRSCLATDFPSPHIKLELSNTLLSY